MKRSIDWLMRLFPRNGDAYLQTHVDLEEELPSDEAQLRWRLSLLVKRLEFAIAHHDFPRARQCARAEERVRMRLNDLERHA